MRPMRTMGLALFCGLFAMALDAGHPANAAGFKVTSGDLCQAVVDENLRKLAIDAQGALVIDLTQACRVRQVYTRGACRLPGIKSSC